MRKFLKWVGVTAGTCFVLLVIVAVILAVWKPWAPKIVVSEPGRNGQRVTDGGLLANYYSATREAPGIVVLGGSEGGLSTPADRVARHLNAAGYSVMALSYWGGADQPDRMEELPLEYFDRAIAWLQQQDKVDADVIGLFGGSKGAEAALLVAARNPAVTAVVANAPSHVAWAGIDMAEIWRMWNIGSTWSVDGEPVPFVPYGGEPESRQTVDMYRAALEADPASVKRAAIRVEETTAPIMMVCGEDDTMWPSCDMARALRDRTRSADGPKATILAYEGAGHMAQGPPATPNSDHYDALDELGGSVDGNQAALQDSWPRVLSFLDEQLPGRAT